MNHLFINCLVGAVLGLTIVAEADLTHRYVFDYDVNDVVGEMDGSPSTNGTYLEVPQYSTSTPSGGVGGTPANSLEVGMSYGTKKSGFQLASDVINTNTGSYSFWMTANSMANGNYVFAPLPVTDGPILLGQSSNQIQTIAGNEVASIIATFVPGSWTHISVTWNNPTGEYSLYVNGSFIGSTNFTPNSIAPTDVRVGGFGLNDDALNLINQYNGKLYDIQLYDHILSSNDVSFLYENPGHVALMEPGSGAVFVELSHETIVASVVVTDMPYYADNTGVLNAGPAIQAAIDHVVILGGGVVFLPAGRYRIDGNLILGYGVTLVGERECLDEQVLSGGSILLAYTGRGDPAAPPFITLDAECGLINMGIYYPEQTPENIQPYPPTILTYGIGTLRNVMLCNSYYGIECAGLHGSVTENIYGTVLNRGIFAPYSLEFGWMRDIHFSNLYWELAADVIGNDPMTPTDKILVGNYTRQNLIGLEIQRLDGLAVDGFSAEDAMLPVFMQVNASYPNNVFGLGGHVANFPEARNEQGWAAWYYGMHYGNLNHVPEVEGKQYIFASIRKPARTDGAAFIDVTRSPYAAKGDQIADDTYAIQKALSDAGANGGGTVYLPQGIYKVSEPLVVPAGVELRGAEGMGKVRENRTRLCTIASYYGHDTANPETAPALITLEDNAGVRGFSIAHPLQPYDVAAIKPYPYTLRGNGNNIWMVDMLLVNSYYGIDLAMNRNDNFLVRDLWATVYHKGIDVGGGSLNGKLERLAFSVGVALETFWFGGQRTAETTSALRQYILDHAVYYSFGVSSGLTTWGLVGFAPDIQWHFYEENGFSIVNAEFWLSMLDVTGRITIQADRGQNISLFGFWATSWGTTHNWLEVDSGFQGPLKVYGKTIQQTHQVRPLDFTAEQVLLFDEASLTTEKAASASATQAGSSAALAVDRDLRTVWEAPAGSYLEVDLGEVRAIDRFEIQSGLFEDAYYKITRAEIWVSTDGLSFSNATTMYTSYFWGSGPIDSVQARYIRLYPVATDASRPIKVAGFDVFNTSATVRPTLAVQAPLATLKWGSWPGHTYSVWHTDSLTNDFTEIVSGIVGTGGEIEFTDTEASQSDQSFYRLKANSDN